jgi:anti-sigma factor RsiW
MEMLTECARRGERLPEHLEAHLRQCPRCLDHWAAEESLGQPFRKLRQALAGEHSPASRRRQLMEEFDRMHRPSRAFRLRWAWAAAAAVLAAVLVMETGRIPVGPVAPDSGEFAIAGFPDVSEDNGFVPVAYSEPLAAGESVRVVHDELDGAELAAMGIDVPGAFGNVIDADIVLGEDGLPRAVRLSDY